MANALILRRGVKKMTTVQQLLDEKGHDVCSVCPDDTVFNAIQKMASRNIGSVVVLDDDKLVGIFTERIYARNIILKGRSSPRTPVRDIMATDVVYIRPTQMVSECMAIMSEKRTRHLPVLDDEQRIVGIISIGDLLQSIIKERNFTIDQLEHYIQG
jgi:CBS domain-containing protein